MSKLKRFLEETVRVHQTGKQIKAKKIIHHPNNINTIFLTYQIDTGEMFKRIISSNNPLKLDKSSTIHPEEKFLMAMGSAPLVALSTLEENQKFSLYYTPFVPIFIVVETSSTTEWKIRPLGKRFSQQIKKSTMVLSI